MSTDLPSICAQATTLEQSLRERYTLAIANSHHAHATQLLTMAIATQCIADQLNEMHEAEQFAAVCEFHERVQV